MSSEEETIGSKGSYSLALLFSSLREEPANMSSLEMILLSCKLFMFTHLCLEEKCLILLAFAVWVGIQHLDAVLKDDILMKLLAADILVLADFCLVSMLLP